MKVLKYKSDYCDLERYGYDYCYDYGDGFGYGTSYGSGNGDGSEINNGLEKKE
jgi:hypothetical protein